MIGEWFPLDNEKKILEKIAYSAKLYREQVKKAEKEKYLEGLLLDDYVFQIRQHQTIFDVFPTLFKDAQTELSIKDKRRKRVNLTFLKQKLEQEFFNNESVTIDKIFSCGLENYAWKIDCSVKHKTYSLEIPVKKNLTAANIEYAHHGRYTLFSISNDGYFYDLLIASYDSKEISNFVKQDLEVGE